MTEPELPKTNTIGITYNEGSIKPEHYERIIEQILGVPEEELYGIDERGDTRFIFKVTTDVRYDNICENFLGKEIEVETGFKIQVDDISANKTRVCISRVPFEVSNPMLHDVFTKFGKVHKCQDYFKSYGKYSSL